VAYQECKYSSTQNFGGWQLPLSVFQHREVVPPGPFQLLNAKVEKGNNPILKLPKIKRRLALLAAAVLFELMESAPLICP